MAFDLTTAQPVKKQATGFDLGSAKPSRSPKVVATEERRKKQIGMHEDQMRADRDENESSLGGIVHGTIEGLKELDPIGATKDYFKDYAGGIATELEDDQPSMSPTTDAALGLGSPILTYPASMVAGAVMAPFRSGDYRTEQTTAFNAMNDLLPQGAKDVQENVGALLKPVGDLIGTVGSGLEQGAVAAGADPDYAANVVNPLIDVAEFATVKRAAPKGTPGLNPGPPKRQPVTPGVTADPVARARDAGYTMPASARTAEGKPAAGPVARVAETVSGKTQNQHRVDQLNDQRVLAGMRKDLGLGEKTALTQPVFDTIMAETGKVYDGVAKALPTLKRSPALEEAITGIGAKRRANPLLKETPSVGKLRQRLANAGDVDTKQVLDAIEEFRADARLLSQKAEKPESLQRAKASREAADALEKALDEALTEGGRPDVIPSLKNARMKRAKTHQVREVVNGKKRPGIALMDMDQAGEALSGEMKLAADVHRDFSEGGSLGVNMASGPGQVAGGTTVTDLLQGAVRPVIQPLLNSEFGQARMFGPRVPESLDAAYPPREFDVPAREARQAPLLGPGVDLEPGPGSAGGQMPSDTRRLNSTIAEQLESQGPNADLASQPGMPGRLQPSDERRLARTTEQQNQIRMEDFNLEAPEGEVGIRGPAALSEADLLGLELSPGFAELEAQLSGPIFERRTSADPYTGIDRRVNGVPDLSAERQRVLDRPIGTPPNAGVADALLADPAMQAGVRADSTRGRIANNPAEAHGRMIGEERALAMQEIDSAIAENPSTWRLVGARYEQIKQMTDPDAQLDALDALREDMVAAALMREK
jgi:hypothetical protein